MAELNIQINPYLLESMLGLVERINQVLQIQLVVPVEGPEDDELLLEAWQSGLLESLQEDCLLLVNLLRNKQLGKSVVAINDSDVDGILRACSAVRLKIKETFLDEIDDKLLENGEVNFYQLKPEEQQTYACYAFLAGLQEILIEEMSEG